MFDSNQSLSGSSNPSACYDAKKSCIRLLGEGSLLEGSILEMDHPEQSGTFLLGEVMEIVIMGEGMIPLAVHNERVKKTAQSPASNAAAPAPAAKAAEGKGGSSTQNNVNDVNTQTQPKKYVYDELRRAEIQSLMKDKSIGRKEKLRRMAEIKTKYEVLHSQTSTLRELELDSPAEPDTQIIQQSVSSPTRAMDRWNRGAVAAVSANTLKQNTKEPKPVSQPQQALDDSDRSASSAVDRWNRGAVAAVSANTLKQGTNEPKPNPQPQQALDDSDRSASSAVDRWNRGAVAAVSANTFKQSTNEPKPNPQPRQALDNPAHSASSAVDRWNRGAVAAVSANTLKQSIVMKQPSEQMKNINEEDVDDLIRLLRFNHPSLTSLILDGRRFDEASWEALFDSVEENTHVKELSLVNCNLDDSSVGTLVLALVENETLISINLSHNEDLTDDTGELLRKVLRQGNAFVKRINIEGTSISTETADKIQTILDERDDTVKLRKLQEARSAKIKALLEFSASGEFERSNRRFSKEENEGEEDEGKEADPHTLMKRRLSSNRSSKSVSSKISQGSGDSSSKSTGKQNKANRRVSIESQQSSFSGRRCSFSGNSRPSPAKANMAARQMANLGGDMNDIGKNASQLKELRRQRGECVHCGQKCFKKTMFKATPLSIPGKVQEGRCLRCVQFS